MSLPKLPARAAYLSLSNSKRRNALSRSILQDLRDQLHQHLRCPATGQLMLLPPFKPAMLESLEKSDKSSQHSWLTDSQEWRRRRDDRPQVLVLRSPGHVFCSGHDLGELSTLSREAMRETFDICAEVMTLIRRYPGVVVAPVQGLATAAGFQLAMTADVPIALGDTKFQLPGMSIGLPCTSPSVAVSRRLPPALAYRMFATAEPVTAADLGSGVLEVVPVPEHAESTDTRTKAFEDRVAAVVAKLAATSGQAQAIGKWAFWTQLGMRGQEGTDAGGDGYEDAATWAGRVMTLHARSDDAKEGIAAWKAKRAPEWKA